ncbi:MAG: TadE/TadG family type IV pilus assembly protein [Acidimicrobiia bacterium]
MIPRDWADRLKQRVGSTGRERGAALVEFALVLPLLVALTFGIVEFSSAYHDSSLTADATRAGGRVGSAQATSPNYASSVVDAVNAALSTVPANAPQELWIYKANSKGYPGSGTDFSTCGSNCIKYTWNQASRAFNAANSQGGGWPASSHQVCKEPFDEIGVYLKLNHNFVTRLFGASVTLTDHSVFRFEPVPTSVCAP